MPCSKLDDILFASKYMKISVASSLNLIKTKIRIIWTNLKIEYFEHVMHIKYFYSILSYFTITLPFALPHIIDDSDNYANSSQWDI